MALSENVRRLTAAALAAGLLAAAAVAGSSARGAEDAAAPEKITIGYQFGIGYTPLLIIKQQRLLEKAYPGLRSSGTNSPPARRSQTG